MKPVANSQSFSEISLSGEPFEPGTRPVENIGPDLSNDRSTETTHDAKNGEPPRPPKRLLLADDQRSIRESLSRLLSRQNYHVVLAENGRKAVERASTEDFDLVLLDLSMPELDGWEAIKRIASLKPLLPIVVITAHSDQRRWVEPSGAWALLEKPLNIPVFLATIHDLTESPSVIRLVRFNCCSSSLPSHPPGLLSKSGINE
jgi:CheY-like chemotaxis protein